MLFRSGPRKKTRDKFKKALRRRGMAPVTTIIQSFDNGTKVHIVIDSSVQKGMPHRRFHGKTGTVIGKRGRAWILEVHDGNKLKTVISKPQHLKPQKL